MARPIAQEIPESPVVADNGHHPGLLIWESQIRVITPLFGGGATPGVTDPVTVVRPSSIRGHLRFWWRATQGAQFQTAADLRKREDAIWGSVETPSQVIVEVREISAGRLEACATFPADKTFPKFTQGYPAYALFPFQGNKREGVAPAMARRDVEFRLTIRYRPEHRNDVFAGVWAWTNFGGLGARTRRGCGALVCEASAPKSAGSLAKWWASGSKFLKTPTAANGPEWARMERAPLFAAAAPSPMAAWDAAVGLMREFRQGENVGRNRGTAPNRPGRSRWPEADSLRSITGEGEDRHLPGITTEEPAFPRAELGLPIVFHFKDQMDSPNNSELYPQRTPESHRMASPVIVRPFGIWGRPEAFPMVLVLTTPGPEDLQLRFEDGTTSPKIGPAEVRRPDLAAYGGSPMAGRSAEGSALEAFQAFATQKGYRRP